MAHIHPSEQGFSAFSALKFKSIQSLLKYESVQLARIYITLRDFKIILKAF